MKSKMLITYNNDHKLCLFIEFYILYNITDIIIHFTHINKSPKNAFRFE